MRDDRHPTDKPAATAILTRGFPTGAVPGTRTFTADQAREYGLIDHILGSVDDVRPKVQHLPIGLSA
mgnify:CR=1 FL=1